MAFQPMAVYGLEVPCGDVAIPAKGDIPAAFRITMAAVDPSAESEGAEGSAPRATLKIIRQHLSNYDNSDDEDEEDFDPEEMDAMLAGDASSDDDEDEEMNGGPSDPAKTKKARKEAAQAEIKKLLAGHDVEMNDEALEKANGKSAKAKGKMPASEDEDEDDEDDDDESADEDEIEEFVLCTLDPSKHYQQTLDITIGEDEAVYFKVSGTHSIFLTGNYIEPIDNHNHGGMYDSEDDEDDYGMEGDSEDMDEDMESDELDDMDDSRITEVEDEDEAEAPKLIKTKDKKGKNKRSAPESEDDASLDNIISKSTKTEEPTANGDVKLSKKQMKKLKKNDGAAAAVAKEEETTPGKSDKKVSFASNLEQGPTGKDSKAAADKPKATLGVKTVQGVTIDDKKLGTGPAAKAGDRVGMRYIGKLQKDNKVFDSNKKGKPFTFKLGSGEVIKGWDIGIAGMTVGSERRITIPANLGYGKQGAGPDIPPNATLVFDVKVIELNKGK